MNTLIDSSGLNQSKAGQVVIGNIVLHNSVRKTNQTLEHEQERLMHFVEALCVRRPTDEDLETRERAVQG